MKLSVVLLCALVAGQAAFLAAPLAQASRLQVGYYNKKCEGADGGVEGVVRRHVSQAINKNHRVGAALIRLVFHDCFVGGCDGSVLLDKSYQNPHPEKEAPVNIGLAGFDLLENIKAEVEWRWPGVVSCSDILVYAARDATNILSYGKINYTVTAGRLDGILSSASQAQAELPGSTFSAQELIESFARKDFNVEEMVILSGAHSIGVCHCSSFADRLTAPPGEINQGYRDLLDRQCKPLSADPSVPNNVRDQDSKYKPGLLDNSYYHNNLALMVNFHSDWQLVNHTEALGHVHEYADNGTLWNDDFAESMVKLSELPMLAGNKGGIRKKCSIVGHPLY